jgi:hypothetical protein
VRAWSQGNLVLVPPAIWSMQPRDRRQIRNLFERAADPEAVEAIAAAVRTVAASFEPSPLPTAGAQRPLLSREQVVEFYARMAGKRRAVAAPTLAPDQAPSSEGGRYTSSVLTENPLATQMSSDAELLKAGASGRPAWQEREKADEAPRGQAEAAKRAKTQSWIEEWARRMKSKVPGRKPDE